MSRFITDDYKVSVQHVFTNVRVGDQLTIDGEGGGTFEVLACRGKLDRAEGDFLKEMEENEEVRFHVHRIIDELERLALADELG